MVTDERIAKFIDTCRAMGDAGDGARYDWWDDLAAALTEFQSLRAQGGVAVANEAARLLPYYQSNNAHDAGRRQILEHFLVFGARLSSLEASPAPVSEYAATRDELFEAASDPTLSDAAVRKLCLAKLGPVTSEVREWATALAARAAPSNPVISDEWPEPPEGWQRTKPTYVRKDGALRVEFVYGREGTPWCVSMSLGNGACATLSYHATPQEALTAALSVKPQSGRDKP